MQSWSKAVRLGAGRHPVSAAAACSTPTPIAPRGRVRAAGSLKQLLCLLCRRFVRRMAARVVRHARPCARLMLWSCEIEILSLSRRSALPVGNASVSAPKMFLGSTKSVTEGSPLSLPPLPRQGANGAIRRWGRVKLVAVIVVKRALISRAISGVSSASMPNESAKTSTVGRHRECRYRCRPSRRPRHGLRRDHSS